MLPLRVAINMRPVPSPALTKSCGVPCAPTLMVVACLSEMVTEPLTMGLVTAAEAESVTEQASAHAHRRIRIRCLLAPQSAECPSRKEGPARTLILPREEVVSTHFPAMQQILFDLS